MYNKDINGYQNEEDFANYLNGKRVGEILNFNFIELLECLYGKLNDNDIIECFVNRSKRKADIYIRINGYIRGISIKKGIKNSVHVESIFLLISFFRYIGITEDAIEKFLYYHYADGTTNGTGKERISSQMYRSYNQTSIDKINKELNSEKYIDLFINRFILQGNKSLYEVDALIYGTLDDFLWLTKKEVYYIIKKHLHDDISSLHISSMTIQPMSRNLNYNPKYEFCRYQVQVKWYNILDCIIEVLAFYRKNYSSCIFQACYGNKKRT